MNDLQVRIDAFCGPLDLLLYLVKRDEVDVRDVPVARIADQFLEAVATIEAIDVEWAGDFLVMAATLMEIKSRMLLPHDEAEAGAEDDDPRLELVKQLIEYKKFKEAAGLLDAKAQERTLRLARAPVEKAALDPSQQPLRRVELWDLVSAFGRLMRETVALQPRQIVMDDTPLSVHMARIEEQVRAEGRVPFARVFAPPLTRGRLLGLFLALLELVKSGKIAAEQDAPFGDLWLAPAAPPMSAEAN